MEDTSSIAGGGRFRKSDGLLSQGSLLEDESDTLAQAGLRDGAVLYFEPGRALSRLEMELRCVLLCVRIAALNMWLCIGPQV